MTPKWTVGRKCLLMTSLLVSVLLVVCIVAVKVWMDTGTTKRVNEETIQRMELLWENTVSPALAADIQLTSSVYSLAEVMYVPMVTAFSTRNETWLQDFYDHFCRTVSLGADAYANSEVNTLSQMDYFAFAAAYLALCEANDQQNLVPVGLDSLLYERIIGQWESPAWHWGREDYPDMAARIQGKLNKELTDKTYYVAYIDEELFLLSAASCLRWYYQEQSADIYAENIRKLEGITKYIPLVMKDAFVFQDGAWRVQPGVWADHPEMLYSNYKEILPDMKPAADPGIELDVSHFSRWPIWL